MVSELGYLPAVTPAYCISVLAFCLPVCSFRLLAHHQSALCSSLLPVHSFVCVILVLRFCRGNPNPEFFLCCDLCCDFMRVWSMLWVWIYACYGSYVCWSLILSCKLTETLISTLELCVEPAWSSACSSIGWSLLRGACAWCLLKTAVIAWRI